MSRVLLTGKLRVDAQRAGSKLRDHLLADPSTWLCEVVRAAAMSNATLVHVEYDSDDVWVTFDGAPWPVGFLETAAADLGVELDARERTLDRRSRLLALAMYAALGDEADAVEVFVRDPRGEVIAARLEAEGLADPSKTRAAPRRGPKAGREVRAITVHVERPTSLRSIQRFVRSTELPEVTTLRERWSPTSVAVTVNGKPLRGAPLTSRWTHEPSVSSQVQLEFVATAEALSIHFYERGILLAIEHPTLPSGRPIPLPLVVRVHADDVPSNISRSRVREDHVRAVTGQVLGALADAARGLASDRTRTDDPRLQAQANEVLGRIAWGVLTSPELMSSPLAFVVDLRLLEDVWGGARALTEVRSLQQRGIELYVCRADQAVPPEARALVEHLYRARSGSLDALVFARATPFEELEPALTEGLQRRAAALARPEQPLTLPNDPRRVVEGSVELHGARATVGVRTFDSPSEACVELVVDGRVIEVVRLPLPEGALPFDAITTLPPSLVVTPRYDGVQRTAAFEGFMTELMAAATNVLDVHRDAITAEKLPEIGPLLAKFLHIPGHGLQALAQWKVWRMVSGAPGEAATMASTAELRVDARRDQVVRYVSPETAKQLSPQPQPILVLSRRQAIALAPLLSPARLEEYDAWAQQPHTPGSMLLHVVREHALADSPAYLFERDRVVVAVAVGREGKVVRVRRNQIVGVGKPPVNSKLAAIEGLVVAIEDDAWIPALVDQRPVLARMADQFVRAIFADPDKTAHLRSAGVRRAALSAMRQLSLDDDLAAASVFILAQDAMHARPSEPDQPLASRAPAEVPATPVGSAPAERVVPARHAPAPPIARSRVEFPASPQAQPSAAFSVAPATPFEMIREMVEQLPLAVRLVATETGPAVRLDPADGSVVVNLHAPTAMVLLQRGDLVSLAAAVVNERLRGTPRRDLETRWLLHMLQRTT